METRTRLKVKKKSIILLILAIIVIVGLSLVLKYYNDLQPVNKQEKKNIEFVLKPGMTAK